MLKALFVISIYITALTISGQNIILPSSAKQKGRKVSLNNDSLLITFFPGKLHVDFYDDDTCTYVSWSCQSCDTITFKSWLEKDHFIRFPEKEKTQTQFVKTIFFQESGKQYAAAFFDSHSELFCEPIGGRGTCAILGAAILQKIKSDWVVMGFNPSIICNGDFGYAEPPTLFTDAISHQNYFINELAYSWNGGMWSFKHYQFFEVVNGIFYASSLLKFQDFMSGENYWNSTLTVDNENEKTIFTIATAGHLNKDNISEMPPTQDMPIGVQKLFSESKKMIDFKLKTHYSLDDKGKIKLINSERIE